MQFYIMQYKFRAITRSEFIIKLNNTMVQNHLITATPIYVVLPNGQRIHISILNAGYRHWAYVSIKSSLKEKHFVFESAVNEISHFYKVSNFFVSNNKMLDRSKFRVIK